MPDGIVLTGLPGSGKTTVGRRVAEILGRRFIDLDEEVQKRTGRSAAEILRTDGEAALRAVDRHAVQAASTSIGSVIATGGGSPLDPLNRWAFMDHGVRVQLDATVDVLATRLNADRIARPLLGPDVAVGLDRTAKERAPIYRAVDVTVAADQAPEVVAAAVIEAVRLADVGRWRTLYDAPFRRHHPTGPRIGRLLIGRGIDQASLADALGGFAGHEPVTVADRRALDASPALSAALPSHRLCAIKGGEQTKTFAELERLLTWLSELGVERGDPLVVAGGGTLGDLGGLAAALHRRGMPLIQIPTTWLAQADSAIGGKVAIDLPGAKNAVGAVWPAWLIVSDSELLETLPEERRRDGLAEALKCGLIGDPALWQLIEERGREALNGTDPAATYAITERAARLKVAVVDRDPYEVGERRTLNLGHTIGHALEVESGYTLAHGEAVGLGLRAMASISARRGADPTLRDRIDDLLSGLGFPLTRRFDYGVVVAALGADKKRERGVQRWILPMAVGRVEEVSDVTDDELTAALEAVSA
jgi:shikimate kinase/3-dehydroquinate synthase